MAVRPSVNSEANRAATAGRAARGLVGSNGRLRDEALVAAREIDDAA